MNHPDESVETLPDKLPAETIRDLSRIDAKRAVAAIAWEWLVILAAIALSEYWWNPALYVAVLVVIASRQHALMVLGHDGSHYTLLRHRRLNDWVADIFLFWPTFFSVDGYRHFHRDHHRYLATERDANRILWRTHTADGVLREEWTYPQTVPALAGRLLAKLFFARGLQWIFRGTISMYARPHFRRSSWGYALLRTGYYAAALALIAWFGVWREFLLYWILPFCTWQVVCQYIRLICEHSALRSTVAPFHLTRTTIPRLWEAAFILPRNIGYHHEHHWYPSVPQYNLPRLHAVLARETRLGQCGEVVPGVVLALAVCTVSGRAKAAAPGIAG